jgi:BirA family biotin operon repressor/biotin-[acetyl-CoA-carboxylase] ligase
LNASSEPEAVCEVSAGGWRVERFAEIDSTSEEARRRALRGDPGRLWILGRSQTGGRGRRGRVWTSPVGNLYASALLIDPCEAAVSPQIGFVAGVAAALAARDLGASDVRLKWPNDLLGGAAKLAGVLVEGLSAGQSPFACVVGFGINCLASPQTLPYPATHMSALLGREVTPDEMFAALAFRFEETLETWRRGEGFARVRADWLSLAAGVGAPVRVEDGQGARQGVFEGLDAAGRMLFRGACGLEIIEAADVFVGAAANKPNETAVPENACGNV